MKPVVMTIGDLMIDKWVIGDFTRYCQEAANIPLLSFLQEFNRLGGVGNVATNLVSTGCDVRLVCRFGAYDPASSFATQAAKHCFNVYDTVVDDTPLCVKTRMADAAGRLLFRLDQDRVTEMLPYLQKLVVNDLVTRLSQISIQAIAVSDYSKGFLTDTMRQQIVVAAKIANVPVFVDCKADKLQHYAGATVLKINSVAAAAAVVDNVHPGLAWPDPYEQMMVVAKELANRHHFENVIVTMGALGAVMFAAGETYKLPLSTQSNVQSVVGAGDVFFAALISSMSYGIAIQPAVHRANKAAGFAVSRPYTCVVLPQEWASITD